MAEAAIVVNANAKKYLKGAIDNTMRGRMFWKMLAKRNGIKPGGSAYDCTWDIEYKEMDIQPYGDGGALSYSRHDNMRQMTIDWRGYQGVDEMNLKERKMNQGDTAIYNRYGAVVPQLTRALTKVFNGELYIDGYAAANTDRFHGLESFMANDGATAAADIVANPSDTYAGRSTALSATGHGGNWSTDLAAADRPNATIATDWPHGQGDTQYDFNSPIIANVTSPSWPGGQVTWDDNCEFVLRQLSNWIYHTSGSTPDCHMLSTDYFTRFQNFQASRERIVVPHKEAQDLGFDDALNFDGVAVKKDYDCPVQTGYTLNLDEVEFAVLGTELFEVHGPRFDQRTLSWLFAITAFGNFRWNVKSQGKVQEIA